MREPHPGDRRVKRLALTPEGERTQGALSARLYEDVPVVNALSTPQQRTFHELLLLAVAG